MDLSEGLAEWTDWDGAAFEVGRTLGVFADGDTFAEVKWVFWTDNPLGNALHEVLLQLAAAGVLARREHPDEQFSWAGGLEGFRRCHTVDPTDGSSHHDGVVTADRHAYGTDRNLGEVPRS